MNSNVLKFITDNDHCTAEPILDLFDEIVEAEESKRPVTTWKTPPTPPTKHHGKVAYGGQVAYGHGSPLTPNITSWGGGPPQWDGHQYHLFVSEIQYGCGMGSWSYFSAAAHAVSPNIDGPYARVDLAVPVWTHNTLYAYSPRDQMHLIFSIGEGVSNSSCNPPIQCANGITPGASHLRPPSPWPANVTCPRRHTTTVHFSSTLDGPWESAGAVQFSGSPAHDPDPLNASFGGFSSRLLQLRLPV
eukprot:INCI18832.1.p1 GENE.INCI18832.1~~INCI18832.1.p1  ORF type:complete len:245 (+),score=22.90 INCI18832.1:87-821(+)